MVVVIVGFGGGYGIKEELKIKDNAILAVVGKFPN